MGKYGKYNGPRIDEGFRLKEGHSVKKFFGYLIEYHVPNREIGGGVWRLKPEVKSALEKAGWEFEPRRVLS